MREIKKISVYFDKESERERENTNSIVWSRGEQKNQKTD
jgi:hypothetical protein